MLRIDPKRREERLRRSYTSGFVSGVPKALRTQLQEMREGPKEEALLSSLKFALASGDRIRHIR